MSITTMLQVPSGIQEFYNRVLLVRAKPALVHQQFGQQKPVPTKTGDRVKFRRYNSLPHATVPLTEGVTPASSQLSSSDIYATLRQYGNWVELTDHVVDMYNTDPVVVEAGVLLGENAGESIEIVHRDILNSGTYCYRAGNVPRNQIVNMVQKAELKKIVRALKRVNAKPWITNPIVGTDKVGTTPIPASFFAIIHPDVTTDLENNCDFVPVHKYSDPSKALEHEVGSFDRIRFIESTMAMIWPDAGGDATSGVVKSTSGTKADVYSMLIFAQNAYGICPLEGKALENIVKPLGAGNDPLNQRATSGWKAVTTSKILTDYFLWRYEFACSA